MLWNIFIHCKKKLEGSINIPITLPDTSIIPSDTDINTDSNTDSNTDINTDSNNDSSNDSSNGNSSSNSSSNNSSNDSSNNSNTDIEVSIMPSDALAIVPDTSIKMLKKSMNMNQTNKRSLNRGKGGVKGGVKGCVKGCVKGDVKGDMVNDKKKKISNRNRVIELAEQPRMILRRKLIKKLDEKELNVVVFPSEIYKKPEFQIVSLITHDKQKSKSQLEFVRNVSSYATKYQTNVWLYKPELDQISLNGDDLGYIKAELLLKHLYDSYVIWIDQNYLIENDDKSIMDIVVKYHDKSLILFYSDYKICMDLMIWKPDNWSINVLHHLYMRKYSNDPPNQVFLEILSHDRDNKHVLVPLEALEALDNGRKLIIKSVIDV